MIGKREEHSYRSLPFNRAVRIWLNSSKLCVNFDQPLNSKETLRTAYRVDPFLRCYIHPFVVVSRNSIQINSKYGYLFISFFFCFLLPSINQSTRLFDCRHQFYLHSRLELLEGRLKVADWSSVVRLIAWIAQADIGDYDPLSPPNALYSQCCQIQPVERCESKPLDLIHRIVQQHKEMKVIRSFFFLFKHG